MAKKGRFSNVINVRNKKASYEYELLDKYVAGMVLQGTEIKSIREGKVVLKDGYCTFYKNELHVYNIHISQYKQGTHFNHSIARQRKLLLNKSELTKIKKKISEKGLTLIPTRLFLSNRGFAKLEIALGKGKKLYDKRDTIKERDIKRDLERIKF
jgi:SsrA-binding protein